jgi:hypothetical protein
LLLPTALVHQIGREHRVFLRPANNQAGDGVQDADGGFGFISKNLTQRSKGCKGLKLLIERFRLRYCLFNGELGGGALTAVFPHLRRLFRMIE